VYIAILECTVYYVCTYTQSHNHQIHSMNTQLSSLYFAPFVIVPTLCNLQFSHSFRILLLCSYVESFRSIGASLWAHKSQKPGDVQLKSSSSGLYYQQYIACPFINFLPVFTFLRIHNTFKSKYFNSTIAFN